MFKPAAGVLWAAGSCTKGKGRPGQQYRPLAVILHMSPVHKHPLVAPYIQANSCAAVVLLLPCSCCLCSTRLQVDCTVMDPYLTELFGRGSREGLLHWLRDGTLVINNVHKVVS